MPQPSTRELSSLLETLQSSRSYRASQLVALSGLGREDAEAVREGWPAIPAAVRREALLTATELAEANVDLDFSQLEAVALDDEDAAIRRLAAEGLWESTDRTVARRLCDLVRSDPDEAVRATAASSLKGFVFQREFESIAEAAGDAVVDALREVASDPRTPIDVRARAIESLAPRSLPWVRTLINDAYYSDDRSLRLAAIHAMGDTADESWVEFLEDQLVSDDAEFRFEAAVAFGTMGSEEGVEPLASLLADEDLEVVFAVINSLGEIGGPDAVERLREFLEVAPPEYTEVVETAIESALFLAQEGDLAL